MAETVLYRGVLLKVTVTLIRGAGGEGRSVEAKTSRRVWYLRKYLKCEDQGAAAQGRALSEQRPWWRHACPSSKSSMAATTGRRPGALLPQPRDDECVAVWLTARPVCPGSCGFLATSLRLPWLLCAACAVLSRVRLSVTRWTGARRLLCPGGSPGKSPEVGCRALPWEVSAPGVEPAPLTLWEVSLPLAPPGKRRQWHPLQCSCWRSPGTGSLVGCRLWGRTESDTTEAPRQQHRPLGSACLLWNNAKRNHSHGHRNCNKQNQKTIPP